MVNRGVDTPRSPGQTARGIPMKRFTSAILVVALLLILAVLDLLLSAGSAPVVLPPDAPRLVVLVVFDQLRADYLERWRSLFARDGGFRRLQEQGAWFQNCDYPYANTVTGAGHATLGTGC